MPFRRSSSDDQLFLFVELEPEKPKKRSIVDLFTDGYECPIPDRFPTGGGEPQKAWDRMHLYRTKDWEGLRSIKAKWFCWNCRQWHYFTKRFFDEFNGAIP